jgi:hypothetical protein
MGRRKLVRIILESNPDMSVTNQQKETPEGIATRKGHQEIRDLMRNPPEPRRVFPLAARADGGVVVVHDDDIAGTLMDGDEGDGGEENDDVNDGGDSRERMRKRMKEKKEEAGKRKARQKVNMHELRLRGELPASTIAFSISRKLFFAGEIYIDAVLENACYQNAQ